jgi:hypothetical protein
MVKRTVISVAICCLVAWSAQAESKELLVKELSRCDAIFFEALASRRGDLSSIAPIQKSGRAAVFSVPDRTHPSNSRIMFKNPVIHEGIKFVGFFDEVVDYLGGMVGYSWGYLVAASVKNAAGKLAPQIWDATRLKEDGPLFVRSEVWTHADPSSGWAKMQTEAGLLPMRGTVERVLLIEPYHGEESISRFGCSIQGNVTEPVLRELRPDLRP